MKRVVCTKIRKEVPEQIKVGEMYYLDEQSIYVGVDNNSHAYIYKDEQKTNMVGCLCVDHFKDADETNSLALGIIKNVKLVQTKFYAKLKEKTLNVLLHKTKDGCSVDIFIDGNLIYSFNVTDARLILKDDGELIKNVFSSIFINDKDRWIDYAECHTLSQTINQFEFFGRESQLDFVEADITFHLKIKNSNGKDFRLEFTNDVNSDTMVCYCHADSIDEMQYRMKVYTGIISCIAGEMNDHVNELLGNTFTLGR